MENQQSINRIPNRVNIELDYHVRTQDALRRAQDAPRRPQYASKNLTRQAPATLHVETHLGPKYKQILTENQQS